MEKRKGFTLVELLAVIAILAIIILISVPVILNIIETVNKNAFKNSAYGIIKAGEVYYAERLLGAGMPEDVVFTFPDAEGLEISGTRPISGTMIISKKGKIRLDISNGKYQIIKDFDDTDIIMVGEDSDRPSNPDVDTSNIDQYLVKQDINYQDGLAILENPDRGWYRPLTIRLEDTNYDIQTQCTEAKNLNTYIVHLRIDIGQLSGNVNSDGVDKNFTPEQLNFLNTLLDTIRKNKLSVVIRFSYSFDGDIGAEPKSFDTIKQHIKQLAPFFNTNKDIISVVEAGFLGPWGEMHSAGQYQQDKYYKELVETLLNNTPFEMTINVRKPYFYKLVTGRFNNLQRRIGVFNDGYFGSLTDLGTFDSDISRDDFVNWMQIQGQYTLYGGEVTTSGESADQQYGDSSFVLAEMPKTHTAYLNNLYNPSVINKWKDQSYTSENSEYNGQTAYKYITDHLGYRMVVRDSKISSSVEKGDICGVNLELENVGFGNIVRTQNVSVILRKGRDYYETTLDVDVNSIKSGAKENIKFYFYIPSDIEDGDWQIYLKVSNKYLSDYAIQFANPDMWDSDLSANYIGKVTIKNTVANEGVKIKQAFSSTATEGHKEKIPTPKVSVKMDFHIEGGTSYYVVETYNIEVGTTINFKDASVLSSLGITIPEGYTFAYAQCPAIAGDWGGYDSLTIPETGASFYEFHVYIRSS